MSPSLLETLAKLHGTHPAHCAGWVPRPAAVAPKHIRELLWHLKAIQSCPRPVWKPSRNYALSRAPVPRNCAPCRLWPPRPTRDIVKYRLRAGPAARPIYRQISSASRAVEYRGVRAKYRIVSRRRSRQISCDIVRQRSRQISCDIVIVRGSGVIMCGGQCVFIWLFQNVVLAFHLACYSEPGPVTLAAGRPNM